MVDGPLHLIAHSHWDRFEDGRLREPESLSPPPVVSLDLDGGSGMLEN